MTNNGIRVEQMMVTPKMAQTFLDTNPRNRNLQKRHVKQLRQEMLDGTFPVNGDTIVIAKGGDLLDGQHRLTAIVESGLSLMMIVVTGVNPEAQATIDRPKIRKAGDWLAINGYRDAARLASVARLLWLYERGLIHTPSAGGSCEPMTTMAVVQAHPDLISSMDYIDSLGRMSRIVFTHKAVPVFIHYLFATGDKAKADLFLRQVVLGENLSAGFPAFALRNKLLSIRSVKQVGSSSTPVEVVLHYIFRAWNAFAGGRKLVRLQLYNNFPIVEGGTVQPQQTKTKEG